jgi:alkanesulfonate monooxygenase SsuD/methylene tetrahydromethanopterin reductase-like flavin-dependent oxidoreductase (luciferase family)
VAAASPFYAAPESALIGTPDQVAAQVRQWAALGVSQKQIRFADFPKTDGIPLYMDEVMPQFA